MLRKLKNRFEVSYKTDKEEEERKIAVGTMKTRRNQSSSPHSG